jgi:Glycosyl transferase family 90
MFSVYARLPQMVFPLLIVVLASMSQTIFEVERRPLIKNGCEVGFSLFRNSSSVAYVGCLLLHSSARNSIVWAEESEAYGYYRGQQQKFLDDVAKHYNGKPCYLFFLAVDDSTIPSKLRREIYDRGFIYLAHAIKIPTRTDLSTKSGGLILQPDFHFIEHLGFSHIIDLASKSPSYSTRIPDVFWRGSTTGETSTGCEGLDRVKVCTISDQYEWLSFKITRLLHSCGGSDLSSSKLFGNMTAESEWMKHKGVLDIDGFVNAWGLLWRLASGSVVYKIDSEYTNAYILKMKPYVHYIPIASNFSDLGSQTKSILDDFVAHCVLGKCSRINLEDIANNAYLLSRSFSYKREVKRVAHEIRSIAR